MSFIWPPMLLLARWRSRSAVLLVSSRAAAAAPARGGPVGVRIGGRRRGRRRRGHGRRRAARRRRRPGASCPRRPDDPRRWPSRGRRASISVPRVEGTVILAFDVSGSMAADRPRADAGWRRPRPRRARSSTSQPTAVLHRRRRVQRQRPLGPGPDRRPGADARAPSTGSSRERGTSLGQRHPRASLAAIDAADDDPADGYYTNRSPAPTPDPTPVPAGTLRVGRRSCCSPTARTRVEPDPLAAAQAAADRGVRIDTVGIGSAGRHDARGRGLHASTPSSTRPLLQADRAIDRRHVLPRRRTRTT